MLRDFWLSVAYILYRGECARPCMEPCNGTMQRNFAGVLALDVRPCVELWNLASNGTLRQTLQRNLAWNLAGDLRIASLINYS